MLRSALRFALGAAAVAVGFALCGCATSRSAGAPRQFRVARPTDRLEEVVRFYRDGLGLPVLGGFQGHAGYDGVMVGLPDARHHLEFTRRGGGPAVPPPTAEHLLVLYIPELATRDGIVSRLAAMGYRAVPPENPYWVGRAVTVPDPDGWRVVLFHGRWRPGG